MSAIFAPITKELRTIQSPSDLFSWRNPKATGMVAALCFGVVLFYGLMHYTAVTFTCRILQLLFAAGAAVGLLGKVNFSSEEVHKRLERLIDDATPCVVTGVETMCQILTWRNYQTSAKVLLVTVVAGFFGNIMSDLVFVSVVLVTAFSVPAVYAKKKDQIDAVLAKIQAPLDKFIGNIKTKVGEVQQKKEE